MATGKIHDIAIDFATRHQLITFEMNEDISASYENLKNKDKLTIEFKQYREKRSLNANAYFHVLLGKIADVQHVSKPFMKNFLLRRYGQLALIDDKLMDFIVRDDLSDQVDECEEVHLKPTSHTTTMANGKVYRVYYLLIGSHEYNTQEMSVLIDGTVSEAKELGIETMTPDDLERMKSKWGVDVG
ncbi:MAG: hypothetical protein PHW34_16380 [Hespellia sp.]|nr:hypothetical protein [Hespellia sp.]